MRFGREVELLFGPMETERAFVDSLLGPYGQLETFSLDRVRDPGVVPSFAN